MTKSLVVVDYGMGNLQSVVNALTFLGADAQISSDPMVIENADAYLLPGVGAFALAMQNLETRGLIAPLTKNVLEKKKPFLGICLGMQLIAESSTEMGFHAGLGWIPARVEELDPGAGIKVPHVGWNDVQVKISAPIFSKLENNKHFYFDHSFHFICDHSYVSAFSDYGAPVVAAVQKDNIFAVQFHPEKSQSFGLKLLRNYLNYVNQC